MIKPTVGRVMWYRPGAQLNGLTQHDRDQPMAAIVAYVWDDHMVNLQVTDHAGLVWARTSVPIVQEGSPYAAGDSPYAEWMPYQKGQAAKTAALERQVGAGAGGAATAA